MLLIERSRLWMFALFLAAVSLKVLFYLWTPLYVKGDSWMYINVAENILQNFCVSKSDPKLAACAPDWGGNHLFGYPAFLAISGTSGWAIKVAAPALQHLLAAISICYLALTVRTVFGFGRAMTWFFAGLLLMSPFQVGWSRAVLTEPIVIVLAHLLWAEVLITLYRQRLSIPRWSLLLSIGIFVRYDLVIWCLFVPILAWIGQRPWPAIRRISIIGLLVALPLSVWIIRSIAVGLPFPPTLATADRSLSSPEGVQKMGQYLGND